MNRNKKDLSDQAWYIFAGFTLVGLGIGMAAGSAGAGLVIGAGAGFLAMALGVYLQK